MRKVIVAAIVLIVPLGLLVVTLSYVRLNVSSSLPYGLYRIHRMAYQLTPGMLVIVLVPGWSDPSSPLLKPVAAVAGDIVCRVGGILLVDGTDYGPVYDVWNGTALPSAVADDSCVTVPPGYVFLASPAPQSKDSRYFGAVPITQLSAIATPLLTWSAKHVAPSH